MSSSLITNQKNCSDNQSCNTGSDRTRSRSSLWTCLWTCLWSLNWCLSPSDGIQHHRAQWRSRGFSCWSVFMQQNWSRSRGPVRVQTVYQLNRTLQIQVQGSVIREETRNMKELVKHVRLPLIGPSVNTTRKCHCIIIIIIFFFSSYSTSFIFSPQLFLLVSPFSCVFALPPPLPLHLFSPSSFFNDILFQFSCFLISRTIIKLCPLTFFSLISVRC